MGRLNHLLSVAVAVLCAVHASSQRSTPESPDYKAAVVEYHPEQSLDATTTFFKNVHNYISLIEEAANSTNNADIIVFPECGLSTLDHQVFTIVPSAAANVVPCVDTSGLYENLRLLSCAAQDNQIYVVVNLSERFHCPTGTQSEYGEECPESQVLNYNTNVAFDRNGAVIAKYRKTHLFDEPDLVTPPVADLVTFDTDFGVTFGMFICFDILFEKPAVQLIREKNITDIIFSTAWFSELPFFTAIQEQAAWSYGMDVNFLASGYNTPDYGCGGSGIFAGKQGPLVYVMPPDNSTHLLIHSVQKKNRVDIISRKHSNGDSEASKMMAISRSQQNYDELLIFVEDLSAYRTQLLHGATKGVIHLCHNALCCDFEVTGNMSSNHVGGERYFNRIIVFDGVRTFDGFATGGIQVCAVVSCTSAEQSSCGHVFSSADNVIPTTFTGIRIRGDFNSGSATQFPNSVLDNYEVLPVDDFRFQQIQGTDKVDCEIELLKETPLLTFGIYGREFTRDGDEVTKSSAGPRTSPVVPLLLLITGTLSSAVLSLGGCVGAVFIRYFSSVLY